METPAEETEGATVYVSFISYLKNLAGTESVSVEMSDEGMVAVLVDELGRHFRDIFHRRLLGRGGGVWSSRV